MFPYPRTGPFADLDRITVEEYHRMIDAHLFDTEEKERCELIEGWIVPKARQSPGHCYVKEMLGTWFRERTLPAGWMYSQIASVVTPDSHPEPDGSIVRDGWMAPPYRYPRADEAALVIEVAGVSLDFDQTVKQRVYARSGIPVYWIVNLNDRRVEVYTDPHRTGYATRTDYHPGQQVPVVVTGVAVGIIPVDAMLP